MSHFNSKCIKKVLKDHTIAPKEQSWNRIAHELNIYSNEKRKVIRTQFIAVVSVLLVFSIYQLNPEPQKNILSINEICKEEYEQTSKIASKHMLSLTIQSLPIKKHHSLFTKNKEGLKIAQKLTENGSVIQEKNENDLLWERFQEDHLERLEEHGTNVNSYPNDEVDALLLLVQEKQQKKAQIHLLKNQQSLALQIHTNLDEVAEVDYELDFFENMKQNYIKFKNIISN